MSQTLTVQYNYGYGGLTLSLSQQQQLQQYLTTALNSDLTASGVGSDIYDYVLGLIDDDISGYNGIDPNVIAWIAGAAGVNSDTSSAGQFIRNYTAAIYQIRYGTAPCESQLNYASNQIAIGFANGILHNGGQLPSIEGLGAIDAGYSASSLFTQGPEDAGGVYSPWAGTLLFPYLNDSNFYTTWLLNMGSVTGSTINYATNQMVNVSYKSIAGTYDIISVLEAYREIATSVSNAYTNAAAYLTAYFSGSTGDPSPLIAATQTFFLNAYGLTAGQVAGIGSGTPFSSFLSLLTSPQYIAGTVDGGTLLVDQATQEVVVNSGPGNDAIDIIEGNGLVDGGGGTNEADYANWFTGSSLTFSLVLPNTSYFPFAFYMQSAGIQPGYDYLYEIQDLIGNSAGDTLDITPLSAANWYAIGQTLTVDLGSSDANQLNLDGSTSLGRDIFSVAPGISSDDVIVSAVVGTIGAGTTIYGVDVVNPGTIVITPGILGDMILLQDPSSYDALINGFPAGTTIDLEGISAVGGTLNALGIFTIQKAGGGIVTLGVNPAYSYSSDSFLFAPDGNGGTDITAEADAHPIAFTGSDEDLEVSNPGSLVGTISNFQFGDTIDLAAIGTVTGATLSADDVLTVKESGGGSVTVNLDPTGARQE